MFNNESESDRSQAHRPTPQCTAEHCGGRASSLAACGIPAAAGQAWLPKRRVELQLRHVQQQKQVQQHYQQHRPMRFFDVWPTQSFLQWTSIIKTRPSDGRKNGTIFAESEVMATGPSIALTLGHGHHQECVARRPGSLIVKTGIGRRGVGSHHISAFEPIPSLYGGGAKRKERFAVWQHP